MFSSGHDGKNKTHMVTEGFSGIYHKSETTKLEPWQNTSTDKLKGKYSDTETQSRWMNGYGPTQCSTNLATCPNVGKKCRN